MVAREAGSTRGGSFATGTDRLLALALCSQDTPEPNDLITATLELARGEALAIGRLLDEADGSELTTLTATLLANALAGRLEALRQLVGNELVVTRPPSRGASDA